MKINHVSANYTYVRSYILNQASAAENRAPGFLKSFLFARLYVCVRMCACVPAPEAINNKSCEHMHNKAVLRLFRFIV